MTATAQPTQAARPIPEFEGVHDIWPRGERLQAVRSAAETYRERFVDQGTVAAVKSIDIAAAPYPRVVDAVDRCDEVVRVLGNNEVGEDEPSACRDQHLVARADSQGVGGVHGGGPELVSGVKPAWWRAAKASSNRAMTPERS